MKPPRGYDIVDGIVLFVSVCIPLNVTPDDKFEYKTSAIPFVMNGFIFLADTTVLVGKMQKNY